MSSKLEIDQMVLDDICSRFLLNIPAQEKDDMVRLCFQIELAHWFYLDFYRPDNPSLPDCRMYDFAKVIFREYPFLLKPQTVNVDNILERWKAYKKSVPTYGAILLDSTLQYVLLVQGFWIKASWGFPKGKVNKAENPEACAVREVLEETGFDISGMIDKTQYAEHHLNEHLSRLYFIPNVPMDTAFKAKTRGEIKELKWFHVNDLPAHRKDTTPKQAINLDANCFFMVIPFVKQIRRWIAAKKGDIAQQASNTPKGKKKTTSGDKQKKTAASKQSTAGKTPPTTNQDLDQSSYLHTQQLFHQGNSVALESIISLTQTQGSESSSRRRRSGRGIHGHVLNSPGKGFHSVESKGRGRIINTDNMPDAWKNFQFDREALTAAINAFKT